MGEKAEASVAYERFLGLVHKPENDQPDIRAIAAEARDAFDESGAP